MTANNAGDKTLTISVSNTGGGDGLIDINADGTIALTGTSGVTVDGSTLSLDGTDTTNLTMTANNAGDKTLTISASNTGGGNGLTDINAYGTLALTGTRWCYSRRFNIIIGWN